MAHKTHSGSHTNHPEEHYENPNQHSHHEPSERSGKLNDDTDTHVGAYRGKHGGGHEGPRDNEGGKDEADHRRQSDSRHK